MPLDPIAIAAAVLPSVTKFAADRVKKLAENEADGKLAALYNRLLPDEKLRKINETFANRFTKELESAMDLPTLQADSYARALTEFLKNPSVQDEIAKPLDGITAVDARLLSGIWAETRLDGRSLILLPEDFDWEKVAKLHAKSARTQGLADDKLRPVIAALSALRREEYAKRGAEAAERTAGPVYSFDLGRYAADLESDFNYLALGSIDTEWVQYENRVRLENVYVPQSAKQALPPLDLTRDYLEKLKREKRAHGLVEDLDEEEVEERRRAYAELTPRPILEVVDDPKNERLVILGDPGLGKSTLLKWLALRWAQKPTGPATFFLELRRAAEGDFLDCFDAGVGKACRLPRNDLHRHLASERSLVLFDGLDEVDASTRDAVVERIVRFGRDYPLARIVVTTRIIGYSSGSLHPETFRNAEFEQFTLQDFDDDEIDRLITRWHGEAFAAADREKYEGRVRSAIEDSPAIRELAANPLLLTMMAILSRSQDLPRDRADLYEKCAELLLRNWDLEKFPELKGKRKDFDFKDKLGPKEKKRILERVAEAMQRERKGLAGNLIGEDKLESIVAEEVRRVGIDETGVAGDLITMLRERNFMLGHRGDGQFAFVHRTFLEYFCARDLKYRLTEIPQDEHGRLSDEDLVNLFAVKWKGDAWHEPLRLLCGMIGVKYAGRCISGLLAQRAEDDAVAGGVLGRGIAPPHDDNEYASRSWRGLREPPTPVPLAARSRRPRRQRIRPPSRRPGVGAGSAITPRPVPSCSIALPTTTTKSATPPSRSWRGPSGITPTPVPGCSIAPPTTTTGTSAKPPSRSWRGPSGITPTPVPGCSIAPPTTTMRTSAKPPSWSWRGPSAITPTPVPGCSIAPLTTTTGPSANPPSRSWRGPSAITPTPVPCCSIAPPTTTTGPSAKPPSRSWRGPSGSTPTPVPGCSIAPPTTTTIRSGSRRGASATPVPGLLDRAAHDDHGDVRQAGPGAGAGLPGSLRPRPLLLDRAAHDDHPDTRPLLLDRAAHDDNWAVRQAAVQELARGFREHPDTRPWLLDRAAHDDHGAVRQAAVQELARGWKDDPEVQVFLAGRGEG